MSSRFPLVILVLATLVAACSGGMDLGQDNGPSDGGESGETSSGNDSGIVGSSGPDATTMDADSTGPDWSDADSDGGSRAGCGAPGQPCCPAFACEGGGCCVETKCVAAGQQCVDRNGQQLGTCSNNACVTCVGTQRTCALCRSEADCSRAGPGTYCQAPGGPFLTGYGLFGCTTDGDCSSDSGVKTCNVGSTGTCVCQSTQYSPRPPPDQNQGAGRCMASCVTDADCSGPLLAPLYGDGTNFVCGAGGHCGPKSCTSALDCGPEFDCTVGQCVRRSCTTDTDCTPSGVCVTGACRTSAGTCAGLPP